MQQQRLQYLLARHLQKAATPEETEELQELIDSGRYENALKAEIAKLLDEEAARSPEETGSFGELYSRIRAQLEIPAPVSSRILRFLVRWRAAAALILGLGIAGYFLTARKEPARTVLAQASGAVENTLYRNKRYILLPDGSTVLLKDNSQLTVRNDSRGFTREVELQGEAFFDIAHDPQRTFVVHTGTVSAKVLGTAFHVRSDETRTEVIVTRGLVEVGDARRVYGKVSAREKIRVDGQTHQFSVDPFDQLPEIPPSSLPLAFDEVPMSDAFRQIGEKFHCHIYLADEHLGRCRITASFFPDETLEEILSAICAMRNSEYRVELDKILITGGTPCS